MKVFDVRVGDRIDNWTVKSITPVRPVFSPQPRFFLFELERVAEFEADGGEVQFVRFTETKRDWKRADEDVEVER